jgi:hypothetical protein
MLVILVKMLLKIKQKGKSVSSVLIRVQILIPESVANKSILMRKYYENHCL